MAQLDRRSFVAALTVLPAGLAGASTESLAELGQLFIAPNDRELLAALAVAILPTELVEARRREMAERFERWVSNFRPGAELNHGYGTGELEQAGADPWPAWQRQLQLLESAAQREHRSGFVSIPAEARRSLVTAQLEALNADRLPAPLSAPHVALALLAWFYRQPEATDLFYRADIRKEMCRPLSETTKKPGAR
jgi:hypothetical protein